MISSSWPCSAGPATEAATSTITRRAVTALEMAARAVPDCSRMMRRCRALLARSLAPSISAFSAASDLAPSVGHIP